MARVAASILVVGLACMSATGAEPVGRQVRPVTESDAETQDYASLKTSLSDAAGFIVKGEEFLRKYPKSTLRGVIQRDLVLAFGKTNQFDKAFALGTEGVKENAGNISLLMALGEIAANQSLRGDKTFLEAGLRFAEKAVDELEAGKSPYEFAPFEWDKLRVKRMASAYSSKGILLFAADKFDDATTTLMKSLQLERQDPYTHLILAKAQYGQLKQLRKTPIPKSDKEKNNQVLSLQAQMFLSYARALVYAEDAKFAWLQPSIKAEVEYVQKMMPELGDIQATVERVRTEQKAEPIK